MVSYMDKITVIIANHNYARYIQAAISSCVAQTVQPYCIAICEDGSTDNSWDTILEWFPNKEFTEEHGVKIYRQYLNNTLFVAVQLTKAYGPSFARNVLIDITKDFTDLYQILDADDMMRQNKLEVLSNKIKEAPTIGLVYADYDILNVHAGNLIREWKEPYSRRRLMQECIVHSGFMVKKETLIKTAEPTGFYDVNMRTCEDWDLELRISESHLIAHVPQSLTIVRNHKDNSTFSVPSQIWQQNWNRIRTKLQSRQ